MARPRAPGANAPPVASPAQRRLVHRVLEQHVDEAAQMTADQMERLLPAFKQARDELSSQVERWAAVQDGELRWTPQSFRIAQAQLTASTDFLSQAVGETLTTGITGAQELALDHLIDEIARFSEVFQGEPTLISLDRALLLDSRRSWLIDTFASSQERYGVEVSNDIRRRLLVDILKGAPVQETIQRLVQSGGPSGWVNLGRLGMKWIPEGLFARHEFWARRIVQTELASVYNMANLDGITAAAGVVPGLQKRWCADGAGCPKVCRLIDGQVVAVTEMFWTPIGMRRCAPAHPFCRCRVGAWVADWPLVLDSFAPNRRFSSEPRPQR